MNQTKGEGQIHKEMDPTKGNGEKTSSLQPMSDIQSTLSFYCVTK